jgi:hypothetical protein
LLLRALRASAQEAARDPSEHSGDAAGCAAHHRAAAAATATTAAEHRAEALLQHPEHSRGGLLVPLRRAVHRLCGGIHRLRDECLRVLLRVALLHQCLHGILAVLRSHEVAEKIFEHGSPPSSSSFT